ncbi:hypothetical protein [Glycomyces rhizosphaerae]|uniref:Uncharacterized protein n=1 Tax=Glycomyces rhizosphaerae TaxID=2054422 RepID=A0ABV7PRN5_9ACTN
MEDDREAEADTRNFKEWIREEPHVDGFTDTADVRAELLQDRDLGFDE